MTDLPEELHILLIEDNPGDFVLIREHLSDELPTAEIHHLQTFKEAESVLRPGGQNFDAILLDLTLPDREGEELVRSIVALATDTPVIVLTGYQNREFGLNTLSMGISDYLIKDEINPMLLGKSIAYSIERNRINRSLKVSEKEYRDLFDLNPQPMWVYDLETLRFLDVNRAAVDHYGYSRKEFLSMTIAQIRSEDQEPRLMAKIKEVRQSGSRSHSGVHRHLKKNGEEIDVEIRSARIAFEGKEARIVLASDVTDKLKIERDLKLSERKFKALVQDGSDLIAILDEEANYKYVAPSSQPILGIPAEDFIGTNALEYIHEEDRERIVEMLSGLADEERIEIAPFRFRDADGNWRWIETVVTNMLDNPAVEGLVANSRDVTRQRLREQELRESLKEKETLLMEIHHRVKNNLAVVSGMMQLQAMNEPDETFQRKLYDSVTRIRTMASIHEVLYQSKSFSRLDLDKNIRELVKNIIQTLQEDARIEFKFNFESIKLNINQAIPCSLIVNEVVTNILKHAYDPGQDGQVTIDMHEKKNRIFLKIEDNGKGLPEDFNAGEHHKSLGLTLIDTLVHQLGAKQRYESTGSGSLFELQFERAEVKGTGSSLLR